MVLCVSLSFSVTAQVQYDASANHGPINIDTKSLVILYTSAISKNKLEEPTEPNHAEVLSISKVAADYDKMVRKELGSYVNPYNNQLMIVPVDDTQYTKVRIVKKGTGISVIKKRINNGNNLIDMSSIEPGRYILILTNEKRNIYSEEITII